MNKTLKLVHDVRRAANKKNITVQLAEPQSDDEICPISQSHMSEAEVQGLSENTVFDPTHPSLTCMQLECGHRFNAINILYHFTRNKTVTCPVCRRGEPSAHIHNASIPKHIRVSITRRTRTEQERDRREAIQNDAAVAQAFGVVFVIDDFVVSDWINQFVVEGRCHMEVRYMDNQTSHIIPLRSHIHRGEDIQFFSLLTPSFNPTTAFQLMGCVDHIRFPASAVIEPSMCHGQVDASMPNSTMTYKIMVINRQISYIIWNIPTRFFMSIAMG